MLLGFDCEWVFGGDWSGLGFEGGKIEDMRGRGGEGKGSEGVCVCVWEREREREWKGRRGVFHENKVM